MKLYIDSKTAQDRWNPKTLEAQEAIFEALIEIVGDLPIDQIGAEIVTDYISTLKRVPTNRNKIARFRGLPIREQIELVRSDQDKTLSPQTINNTLTHVGSFFAWAHTQGWIDRNPIQGQRLADRRKASEQRDDFTERELSRIFTGYIYNPNRDAPKRVARHPYCFWVPLIGLYSGARINEICQLHVTDVRLVDSILVFDVTEDADKGQTLKTVSSRRLVPVHPELIRIGISEFVDWQRARGHQRLFPELPDGRDGPGQTASKWFARYRGACGITGTDGTKTFHSFRHTFANRARQLQLSDDQTSRILGHALTGMTKTRYAKEFSPKLLFETISQITFPSVDSLNLSFNDYRNLYL